MSSPTVSLCMIVKNEEKWIGTAIASAQSVVSEVIVVDTGSTDRTIEIAESLGAKVIPFKWIDDFSAARNASLQAATSEWILVLDADETLDVQACNQITDWLKSPTSDKAYLTQTTYSFDNHLIMWQPNRLSGPESDSFPGYIESPLVRLFKRDEKLFFVNRIHEELADKRVGAPQAVKLPIRIHHYGQVRNDPKEDKQQLYYRIGKKKVDEHPDDAKVNYEFAVASWEIGQLVDALKYFNKTLELFPTHVPSMCAVATLERQNGNYEESINFYRRALQLNPKHIGAMLGIADTLISLGKHSEAGVILERALDIDAEHPLVLARLGEIYYKSGMGSLALSFLNKAMRLHPNNLPVQIARGEVLLSLQRNAEAEQVFSQAMKLHNNDSAIRNRVVELYKTAKIDLPNQFQEIAS